MRSLTIAFLLLWFTGAATAYDALVADLQSVLLERGCAVGKADGVWGRKTAGSLANIAAAAGIDPSQPVNPDIVAKIRASDAKCTAPSLEGLSPVQAAARVESGQLKGWSAAEMRESAARNRDFCQPEPWDSFWLGSEKAIELQRNLVMVGDDLAMYRANSNGYVSKLHRLNAEAAVSGDVGPVRAWLLEAAANRHFTRLTPFRPKTWEGKRVSWIGWYGATVPEAEPAFYGSLLLLQASVAYAMVKDSLSAEDDAVIRAWGSELYRTVTGAKKTLMQTAAKRRDAPDIRAAYAGAFLAWGAMTQDIEMFRRGAMLFQEAIGRIRPDGTEMFFANGTKGGLELKYQNFTYGGLVVAAHILHRNGIDAYGYAPKGGISLAKTMALHFEASFDPAKRKRIQKTQDTLYMRQVRSHGDQTFAYAEFLARDGILPGDPFLQKVLERRRNNYPQGYYGYNHGGYTSCLFGPG